jgi:Zn-dependent M16 (insulinase) family peptidase
MVDKIARQAKERLETTKSVLGEDGLKKKAQELEVAQRENDRPIPAEMITSFPISDVNQTRRPVCV